MDRVERRFDLRSGLVVSLAAKYHLPAIYAFAYFPTSGGLVSYGIDPFDSFRRAPAYVDAILRGTKPQDLPVQFPTKLWAKGNIAGDAQDIFDAVTAASLTCSEALRARAVERKAEPYLNPMLYQRRS